MYVLLSPHSSSVADETAPEPKFNHQSQTVIKLSLRISCGPFLGAHKSVHLQHANLKVARGTQRRIVEGLATIRLAEANVLVHPDRLPVTGKEWPVSKWIIIKCKLSSTHPPPMVIILVSAAINNSEPCPCLVSPSMPTHGYLALSG